MSTVKLRQQLPLQTAVLKPEDTAYRVLSQPLAEGSSMWLLSGIQVVNITCAKDVSWAEVKCGRKVGFSVYNPPKSAGCPWFGTKFLTTSSLTGQVPYCSHFADVRTEVNGQLVGRSSCNRILQSNPIASQDTLKNRTGAQNNYPLQSNMLPVH